MTSNVIQNNLVEPSQVKKQFPQPETNLAKILSGSDYRTKFHANLKTWNPVIAFLYRMGILPLLGMSKTVMLLITRGCKSGKIRYTPIGYFTIGGKKYLISAWGRGTGWYRNLTASPQQVAIQIGLKKQSVIPQELTEPTEIRRTLEELISESPDVAKYLFGWDPGVDELDKSDFSQMIERVMLIRFIPK